MRTLRAVNQQSNRLLTFYSYGNTLTAAANDGTINIIKMLLDKGANINSPAGWPLQAAATQGHIAVIQEFIARGADINAMTTNEGYQGGTALQVACRFGQTEIVRLLLEHGADPNLGAGGWACPLVAAAGNGEEEITGMLLKTNVAVNVYGGPYRSTPLMLAAAWLSVDSVRLILQAGADIDLLDQDGDTALILAARRGDSECAKVLLEHGADIMHTNNDGHNALQIALDSEVTDCIRILVDAFSRIVASVKTEVDAGDETAIRIVERARQPEEKPTIATSEDHADASGVDGGENEPEKVPGEPGDDTQPLSETINTNTQESIPQQQQNLREPAPGTSSLPSGLSSTEHVEPDYTSTGLPYQSGQEYHPPPSGNPPSAYQQGYQNTTAYSQNGSYQSYNPGPPANYPTPYNTQPPTHQPYNSTSYENPNFQTYNSPPATTYGQPQGAPGYQSYNANQPPYDNSSYGGQDQQEPPRPQVNERNSSSSMFGMKDTFDKAKQFGINRWR